MTKLYYNNWLIWTENQELYRFSKLRKTYNSFYLCCLVGNGEFKGNINSGESDIFLVNYNSDGVKQ